MQQNTVFSGKVTSVQQGQTAKGKVFFTYQLESVGREGVKSLGFVKSYEDRGYKVGDDAVIIGFYSPWLGRNNTIHMGETSVSMEKEKAALGDLRGLVAEFKKEPLRKVAGI